MPANVNGAVFTQLAQKRTDHFFFCQGFTPMAETISFPVALQLFEKTMCLWEALKLRIPNKSQVPISDG
jgi:hypothetical protein